MSIVSYLILSVALFIVMIVVQALFGLGEHSLKDLAGPRDGLSHKTTKLQRATRANANMLEAMIMFVPLALIAIHTQAIGANVTLGAALFFWGRVVYAPLYWFGVPWLRTLAWAVSLAGILLILLNLLPLI